MIITVRVFFFRHTGSGAFSNVLHHVIQYKYARSFLHHLEKHSCGFWIVKFLNTGVRETVLGDRSGTPFWDPVLGDRSGTTGHGRLLAGRACFFSRKNLSSGFLMI